MLPESNRSSLLLWTAALLLCALPVHGQTSFVEFESGQVRPLALSPDGTKLFAVNTPDNRLEVFQVGAAGIAHVDSIPVGMEPVAVAARSNTEVWVVNHLSDSVSIVDLSATPPRVTHTLLVGDEPRDIVFAGSAGNRAFISTAHRGQQRTAISGALGGGDPQLTTPGIGRADVWVFDATNLGTTLGGTPLQILSFMADTPRALATDGTTVYVAAFHSGNRSTTINELQVCNGFQMSGGTGGSCGPGAPGGVLPPATNCLQTDADPACEESASAPETGIIVQHDGTAWRDAAGRDWSASVPFTLPDRDVFSFDADTLVAGPSYSGVGTILFNMAVNPASGKLFVSNTELPNLTRFEGPGVHGGSTVQGHLSESRISVIDPSGAVAPEDAVDPQHLNPHIVYGDLHTDTGANHAAIDAQIPHSLATPTQLVISSTGTVYLAAFGSSKIGVFSAAELETASFETSFDPTLESANYIATGGGPSGLVLDESHARLYVLTRFDNALHVIDPATKATLATHPLHNPEPASVLAGRPFLYDAQVSSGNGEAACASCHIFGDLDSLAWDLGDPDGAVTTNSQPEAVPLLPDQPTFHPMKGPMTTQTLRGLATHGALHWRGDRVDGFFGEDDCEEPTGAPCSEDFSFRNFIVAFEGLLGKHGTITPAQMQQFSTFMLQVFLPPNPVRPLNNTLTGNAATGLTVFTGTTSDTVATCAGCHNLNAAQGFFGSGGRRSFEGEPQDAKVPHMRNLYAKIGMFSVPGEQIRGFGFLHDGSVDTVNTFVGAPVFVLTANQRTQLEQFALAFPTDLAPIVGQQATLTSSNLAVVGPRLNLFVQRAGIPFNSLLLGTAITECDLIVKGAIGGVERGWVRISGGSPATTVYRDDTNQTLSDASLRALVNTHGPLTWTCVPPGSGTRMGIDRDLDLDLDGLDNCPAVANADQLDSNSNGIGDACELGAPDTDLDGVPDTLDNCPAVSNPAQQDFDGDSAGDACDTDDDADGLLDSVETGTGIYLSPTDTGSNALDADSDDDGYSDGSEVAGGSDPNDANSPPPGIPMLPWWATLLLIGLVIWLAGRWLQRSKLPPPRGTA